jgi:hypothetical protein
MIMNITTDAKQIVYLENIPVGRLVDEGTDQVFYVPGDGGFSQRLLPLNGTHLPRRGVLKSLEPIRALWHLIEQENRAS